jgi:hypothetical protein
VRSGPWRRARVGLTVAVALVAAACASEDPTAGRPPVTDPPTTTSPTTLAVPTRRPPQVPATGAYFGIWRGPGPGRGDTSSPESIDQAEFEVGRRMAIDHRYYDWGSELPGAVEVQSATGGRIPMVSICACDFQAGTYIPWAAIADGSHDAYLDAMAARFAAWEKPAFFAFDSEAEDHLDEHGTPAEYVAAFRHVVDRFRAAGATNVSSVWTTTTYAFTKESGAVDTVRSMYPGDQWVDWIGADPFNFVDRGGWMSLSTLVEPWYRWATTQHPDRPLMLTEWGTREDPNDPGRKAGWYHHAAADLRHRFPEIRAVVYFDERKAERGTVNDWRIDTSPAALAAFREIASGGWFAVMP